MKATNLKQSFSNEELVAGIAENNHQALDFLYQNNFPSIRQFILKNNGEEADAHDVFQEAVITTWMNIKEGKFKLLNGSTLEGYLFQIARNKWLDIVRSKPYRSTMRLVEEKIDNGAFSELDAEEYNSDRVRYLQELYNNLGEKCKRILNAFYYYKKSLKEIGSEMNYDAETLRTMKYRCMMKLRKMHQEKNKTQMPN